MRNTNARLLFLAVVSFLGLFALFFVNTIDGLVIQQPQLVIERPDVLQQVPRVVLPSLPPPPSGPCDKDECVWGDEMSLYVSELGTTLLGFPKSKIGTTETFKKKDIALSQTPSFYKDALVCVPPGTKLYVTTYKGKKLKHEEYDLGFLCHQGKWWVASFGSKQKEFAVSDKPMKTPPLPCAKDSDCPTKQRCVKNKCVPTCGKIEMSFCVPSNDPCPAYGAVDPQATDCPAGMKCCKPI